MTTVNTPRERHLLIALPALDEMHTVGELINSAPKQFAMVDQVDFLVVDDGSKDETRRVAEEAGARVISHGECLGVGAAFQTALRVAQSESYSFFVMIDADGQFDPAHLNEIIGPVAMGSVDFTTASRFLDPALVPEMPAIKLWGNRRMSALVSRMAGRSIRDVSCGCRCYNRKAILMLNPVGRFTYTQEVILNLAFKGLRIREVAIPVKGTRRFGESRVAKSLWRYAFQSGVILFRAYRDYQPLRFFSAVSGLFLLPALGLGSFLSWHYLNTGNFSPHKWSGFVAGFLILLSLLLFLAGVVADMLTRHRLYLEELLFHQRAANSPQMGCHTGEELKSRENPTQQTAS